MAGYRAEVFTQTEDTQPTIREGIDILADNDAEAERKAQEWVAALGIEADALTFARISRGEQVIKNWPLSGAI